MADANKVLEGSLKYRDGKKWKQRWCVLHRLSPVADCLHMFLYKERSDCIKVQSKSTIVLEDFFGARRGSAFDKESHVLSVVCQNRVVNLAFHNQETLDIWEMTIVQHLGGGKSFDANLVRVPQSLKVAPGPVNVFVNRSSICLVSSCPNGSLPRYLASWRVGELRRFGILGNRFCFELEEKNAGGVFLLETSLLNEMNHIISNIAHGRKPDSPSLPPKLCRTGTEPAVLKPRLGSPVCKASSLDRDSLRAIDGGTSEAEYVSAEHGGTVLRRQLSEPREFPVSAEGAASKDEKAGCYHNIWCCNEVPDKVNLVENQRLLCEKLISGCLEISERVTSNMAKTGSLSKICCFPGGGCSQAGENCPCDCRPNALTYVNMQSNAPKQLRHFSSVSERRPSSARPAMRCSSSGDVMRCRTGEETRLLLASDCGDYVNDRVKSSLQQSRRGAMTRRSSDDPASARDPLKPLPYVDLRRFDGDDGEGYLYDLKVPRTGHREFPSTGVRAPARPATYANLPRSAGESVGATDTDAPRPLAVGGRSTFHASLKRPNKFSIPPDDLLSFVPPAPVESSYADLRRDSSATYMLRSCSYYNVQLKTVIPPPPCKAGVKGEPTLTSRKLPPMPGVTSSGENNFAAAKTESAAEVEYVTMNGHSDADDSAIFFTVDIPIKREDLQHTGSKRCGPKDVFADPSVTGSGGVTAPLPDGNSDAAGYVDMSGFCDVNSPQTGSNDAVVLSGYRPRPEHGDRPKLRLSRSLENRPDSSSEDLWSVVPCRKTSHGMIQAKKNRHCSPEDTKDPPGMNHTPTDDISDVEATSKLEHFHAPPNPSDDFRSHAKNNRQTSPCQPIQFSDIQTDRTDTSNWTRRNVSSFASDPAINFSPDRSSLLKSSRSVGLISRILRRHSSAKEKPVSKLFHRLSGDSTSGEPRPGGGLCEPFPGIIELQVLSSKSSSKADGLSNSSCSSSLEKLGPPPPIPASQPRSSTPEKSGDDHYINLSLVSPRVSTPLAPSANCSSDYLNVTSPPPLPPKCILAPKNQDVDPLHRNLVAPVDRILSVEKQPLRSITEDELEVPPLPEKVHARTACYSKTPASDGLSPGVCAGIEASPKPPVPPRSLPSTATSSPTCTASTQRSPRIPMSPVVRHLSGAEVKSRKPNLTVDIAPAPERRGSRDDAATKGPVQMRHLSDLRQSVRVRMVSELSNASISSGEEGRPSPALTTMRPRYGKEYQCVDRRRLYEEGSPFSPQRSPSVTSSVFTFDNMLSNLRGGVSGNCSSGENSPKYPSSLRSRIAGDHVSSSRNISPIVLDPMVDSPPAADARALLNYAEIDLSGAEMSPVSSVLRTPSRADKDKTEYALIDLVATSAASRVGRERARQREDTERIFEALSGELKDGKQGTRRSVALGERKGSAETKRTPSRDQRFGFSHR